MRTRVVIQSRLSSSRLPGKALLNIGGVPLIELVARRVSRNGHEVVVATSDEHYDGRIADHLTRVGIPVVRGPLDDVLGRFVLATTDLDDDDTVVRMTGDNPLSDADLIDELAAATAAAGVVYGRNNVDLAPEGIGCEVFPAWLLRQADREATAPYDREHVTPWIRRAVPELDHVPADAPGDIFRYRATVDNLDDYDVMSRVFTDLEDPVAPGWRELIERVGELRPGPMVPRARPGLHGMSGVVLDTRDATPGPVLRDLVRRAVSCGISHVVVAPSGAAALRDAIDPAVKQRLAVVLQLGDAADAGVVDRARADLGLARLDRLVLPSSAWLADPSVGERLRGDGVVGGIGLHVSSADDLAAAVATGAEFLVLPVHLLGGLDPAWGGTLLLQGSANAAEAPDVPDTAGTRTVARLVRPADEADLVRLLGG